VSHLAGSLILSHSHRSPIKRTFANYDTSSRYDNQEAAAATADDADASSVSSASVSSVQQPQKKPKMKHGFKTTSAKKTTVSAGRPHTAAKKEALKKPGTQPTDRERATTEGAA
jgi:hypothetical protein